MSALTKRQHELLAFIEAYIKENNIAPSFDEMRDGIGLSSKSGVFRLLTALEERGRIRRYHYRARALEVIFGTAGTLDWESAAMIISKERDALKERVTFLEACLSAKEIEIKRYQNLSKVFA